MQLETLNKKFGLAHVMHVVVSVHFRQGGMQVLQVDVVGLEK
jgi:hypothetical protein